MGDWEKAGEITREAREYGRKLIKIGASSLEVVNKIEDKMMKLGGLPAFPTNISINDKAAHCTPFPNDPTEFKEDDIVKLDLGASIEGCMGDSACTISLGKEKKLLESSEEALKNALKIVKDGVEIGAIGKIIQETIECYGFKPIKNLSGHGIDRNTIHSGLMIPNFYDPKIEKFKNTLSKGQIIAIEPFSSTGVGLVKDGKLSGVYEIKDRKSVRDKFERDVLKKIDGYEGRPFCKRWLSEDFSLPRLNICLTKFEQIGILHQYNELIERSKGLVSHFEHTLRVGGKVLT